MAARAGAPRAVPATLAQRAQKARALAPRILNEPRPVRVRVRDGEHGGEGEPLAVDGEHVELMRETWLIEDRWWAERPLRRRYWEIVSARGRNLVVFHDLISGRWFSQAA